MAGPPQPLHECPSSATITAEGWHPLTDCSAVVAMGAGEIIALTFLVLVVAGAGVGIWFWVKSRGA